MSSLFSGRRKLRVDLAELEDKKEVLSSFLQKSLKGEVASSGHNLFVDSSVLSEEDLKGMVNKFLYHQHLNNDYWVALEGGAVRIHKFKEKKIKKRKKSGTTPAMIQHGWL